MKLRLLVKRNHFRFSVVFVFPLIPWFLWLFFNFRERLENEQMLLFVRVIVLQSIPDHSKWLRSFWVWLNFKWNNPEPLNSKLPFNAKETQSHPFDSLNLLDPLIRFKSSKFSQFPFLFFGLYHFLNQTRDFSSSESPVAASPELLLFVFELISRRV